MEDETHSKVIQYIVKNSHYGETKDVLTDLTKLVSGFDSTDEKIAQLCREHNEQHLAILQNPDGYSFVISPAAYEDGGYIDQKNQKKLIVNHIEQQIISIEEKEIEVNPVFEEYRSFINKYLDEYLRDYYKEGTSGYSVFISWTEQSFEFYIAISGKNLNLKNFHGCEWISEWKVMFTGIQGKVRINSHFFEEGNVAFQESQSFKGNIDFNGEDKAKQAKAMIDFIIKCENEIHAGLDQIYTNMTNLYFKDFRRVLPDWNLTITKLVGGKQN